jgi:hypothetical protein
LACNKLFRGDHGRIGDITAVLLAKKSKREP